MSGVSGTPRVRAVRASAARTSCTAVGFRSPPVYLDWGRCSRRVVPTAPHTATRGPVIALPRARALLATFAAAGLLLSGCAANEPGVDADYDGPSGRFNASGSSAQEAAQAAWISGYQEAYPGVTINYSPVGSGAGRANFVEGWTVYAGSDAALDEDEGPLVSCADGATALNLPVYISPIAVIFNVEGVDDLRLDPDTMAAVFNGTIGTWNDPAIAALNPEAALPDAPITVVHRSDDSGTTENFTEYLHDTAPDVWTEEPSDTYAYRFAGADGNQGNSGVVEGVRNGRNTIGYADASRAGGLSSAQILVEGEWVSFSDEAAAAAVAASPFAERADEHDLVIELDRTGPAGSYPLVLVSYMVVCSEYRDARDAAFLTDYASWVASEEGQARSAESAGSAPLAEATAERVRAAVRSIGADG